MWDFFLNSNATYSVNNTTVSRDLQITHSTVGHENILLLVIIITVVAVPLLRTRRSSWSRETVDRARVAQINAFAKNIIRLTTPNVLPVPIKYTELYRTAVSITIEDLPGLVIAKDFRGAAADWNVMPTPVTRYRNKLQGCSELWTS